MSENCSKDPMAINKSRLSMGTIWSEGRISYTTIGADSRTSYAHTASQAQAQGKKTSGT